jgi:hypothetical protein
LVDLATPEDVSELMYALTWATDGEPTFTPILRATHDEVIAKAAKVVSPN